MFVWGKIYLKNKRVNPQNSSLCSTIPYSICKIGSELWTSRTTQITFITGNQFWIMPNQTVKLLFLSYILCMINIKETLKFFKKNILKRW